MGSVNINNTGGGADVTLSSDGTSLLLNGTAVGGSALELYAENPVTPTAPSATGDNAVAIGTGANASGIGSVAIGGNSAQATATDAIAIGTSLANAANGIAIGINNSTTSYGATATSGIAIGQLAKAPTADGIAIGRNANANNGAIAIGYNSYTTSVRGVAVGYDTHAGYQAATFGYGNASTANFSLTVGHSNTASHVNSAAIGYGVQTTASNQVALGGSTQTVRISETYTLPATDGTIGQVLTTNGAGAVTFADAGGGTALELYAENPVTPTAPSATGDNAVAIGSQSSATNDNNIAIGYKASSTGTRNSVAIGTDILNIFASASGESSLAMMGGISVGQSSIALGKSYASGTDSFAAVLDNNTSSYGATGANSIAMGYQARATQANGIAIGDRVVATGNPSIAVGRQITASGAGSAGFGNNYYGTNTVSGSGAVVVTGGGITASGTKSAVFGSYSNATAERSFAFGINATALTYGKFAFSAKGFNQDFYVDGSAQAGLSILSRITTDGTSAYLTGSTSSTSADQIILPNNSAYSFSGMIVARQDPATGTACAAWKVEGLIRREANAASTVLVNYALTVLDNTPGWDITLTADTTVGALKITATGAADTTIRWVATINTAEVNFLN